MDHNNEIYPHHLTPSRMIWTLRPGDQLKHPERGIVEVTGVERAIRGYPLITTKEIQSEDSTSGEGTC